MNNSPRQNVFNRLGRYWNQGAKQKGIVIALASFSSLILCCAVSLIIAATPGYQSFIAEQNATATAQTLVAQEQSATATAYALAHPAPTSTPQPTPTLSPSATPTVKPSPSPTPIPSATPIPTIPVAFVGLGGTETAYENRFGNANECGGSVGRGCWITTIDGCSSDINASVDSATLGATYQRIYETDTQYNCSPLQYPNQDQTTKYCKQFIPKDSIYQQNIPTISGYPAQQYMSRILANTLAAEDFTGLSSSNNPGGTQHPPGVFYMEESADGCTISTAGSFLS